MKNHTTYLPQCEVQVRGVVFGWRDINHCVAAQRVRSAVLVARPDVGVCPVV